MDSRSRLTRRINPSRFQLIMNTPTNKEEVVELIEAAIAKHNVNASLVSMALGFSLMFFYADGLIRVVRDLTPG